MRMGIPFWDRLNAQGIKVGMVNVPFTYPATAVDGFLVCGFGSPSAEEKLTYPEEVLRWIEVREGPYSPSVDINPRRTGATPEELIGRERAHQAGLVRIAAGLADEYQVDVLVINLMLLDHANHTLANMKGIEQSIVDTDADIGNLIESFQPDNVLLISDHGSRRVRGVFLLHAWLRDHGYYTHNPRPASEQQETLNWVLKQWLLASLGWSGIPERAVRRFARQMFSILPQFAQRSFWEMVERTVPLAYDHYRFQEQLDYTRTRLFPGASFAGLIHLNLAGREQSGVVSPRERDPLRDKLIDELMKIIDPETGKAIFTQVNKIEAIHSGPAVDYGPDLILDSYDSPWNVLESHRSGSTAERSIHKYFVENRNDYGWHSRDGIYVFAGKDFHCVGSAQHSSLLDIPATLLHLYDVPIPEDYDGKVLMGLLAPEVAAERQVRYQPGDANSTPSFDNSFTASEADELIDRFKALGYL
jgi:predicted AlkP superfamily phosphohydrolase/phosphomutase